MVRAICIKSCEAANKGDVVKAWKRFGKVYFFRGIKQRSKMLPERFEEHFTGFKNYYIVDKAPVKRRFRKPKPSILRVEFRGVTETVLVELYNHVFSYIELIKQVNKELIFTFNYSIVSTLEKLEFLFNTLPNDQFIEAVKDAEQVFLGIYKTALSLEVEALPKQTDYNQLLENFKQENMILGTFFDELNK